MDRAGHHQHTNRLADGNPDIAINCVHSRERGQVPGRRSAVGCASFRDESNRWTGPAIISTPIGSLMATLILPSTACIVGREGRFRGVVLLWAAPAFVMNPTDGPGRPSSAHQSAR